MLALAVLGTESDVIAVAVLSLAVLLCPAAKHNQENDAVQN